MSLQHWVIREKLCSTRLKINLLPMVTRKVTQPCLFTYLLHSETHLSIWQNTPSFRTAKNSAPKAVGQTTPTNGNCTLNPRAHHEIFKSYRSYIATLSVATPRMTIPTDLLPSPACSTYLWTTPQELNIAWTTYLSSWNPAVNKDRANMVPSRSFIIFFRLYEDTSACQLGEAAPELGSRHDAAYVSMLGARLGISALHYFMPHRLIWRNFILPLKVCSKIYTALHSETKIRHVHLYCINQKQVLRWQLNKLVATQIIIKGYYSKRKKSEGINCYFFFLIKNWD